MRTFFPTVFNNFAPPWWDNDVLKAEGPINYSILNWSYKVNFCETCTLRNQMLKRTNQNSTGNILKFKNLYFEIQKHIFWNSKSIILKNGYFNISLYFSKSIILNFKKLFFEMLENTCFLHNTFSQNILKFKKLYFDFFSTLWNS